MELVRDWGTSLSVALYREAIVELLGGAASVESMVPLSRNGLPLGNQRFYLVSDGVAFELTAFSEAEDDYGRQLQRLINLGPLQHIHWINIGTHCVSFITVSK